jgi:hypothetical protein
MRQDVLGPALEERLLIGADLLDVDLVEARVQVGLHAGEVPFGIRTAGDLFGDGLARHERRRVGEVLRTGEGLGELTG